MFKQGKELVEVTYGTTHPLFAQFSSAMGQAKLKTKYETPGEVRRKKSRSPSSEEKSRSPKQKNHMVKMVRPKSSGRTIVKAAPKTAAGKAASHVTASHAITAQSSQNNNKLRPQSA